MRTLKDLHDDALMDRLHQLARRDSQLNAELLQVLIEVDRRLLYAERGYSSLWTYCVDVLNMPEPSIGVRIQAARCCSRFPRLLEMLHNGQLHLSAIILLSPHLSAENFEQLSAAACHKSKRQLQQLLADLNPKPDVPSSIRKLPSNEKRTASAPGPSAVTDTAVPCASATDQPAPPPAQQSCKPSDTVSAPVSLPAAASCASGPAIAADASEPAPIPSPPPRPTHPEPLGTNRYKIQFTASEQLKDKLEQARALLRHRIPNGDIPELFDYALDLLIREESKRQHGATERLRAKRHTDDETKPTPPEQNETELANDSEAQAGCQTRSASRHIPNHVKREVHARDQGQCTFVSPTGHRCCERGGLQYHHEVPFGKGGESTTANVRLLCRVHNTLLARRDYGQQTIEACIERSRQRHQPAAALRRPDRSAAATARSARLEPASDRPSAAQQGSQPNHRLPFSEPSRTGTQKPTRPAGRVGGAVAAPAGARCRP